ncbi:hypothetical protein [Salinibacterium sp. ZJ454]|uniref:hypothetical protein n=1 Tax=Salinibacterium sp. ZJ454 TaxID=2708339 RepID=UPI0014229E85|nr:hypothetical protein [Salinibacterium sp. ZJ454]
MINTSAEHRLAPNEMSIVVYEALAAQRAGDSEAFWAVWLVFSQDSYITALLDLTISAFELHRATLSTTNDMAKLPGWLTRAIAKSGPQGLHRSQFGEAFLAEYPRLAHLIVEDLVEGDSSDLAVGARQAILASALLLINSAGDESTVLDRTRLSAVMQQHQPEQIRDALVQIHDYMVDEAAEILDVDFETAAAALVQAE